LTKRLAGTFAATVFVLVFAFATSAFAVSGTPVKVGEPISNERPAVAVDSSGTAYIAWADTEHTSEAVVQYCVLPAGETACTHTGTLVASGGASHYIDRVQVLVDEATIVVLADVYGVPEENTPEQEWTSTDGGAVFSAVDGGKSVADGILSADTQPLNAVVVPGTSTLGYGWDSAAGGFEKPFESPVPTFDEFRLSSSPTCSVSTTSKQFPPNCPSEEDFAALQPEGVVDPIGNAGGQFASQTGTSPGVLGVFETDFNSGPLCPGSFGTAFVYGSGDQSTTAPVNSYDKYEPGKPGSAWSGPVAQADCNAEYPAVGGGPSGFGVVEDDLTRNFTVYHPFDQTHKDFDTPYVTIADEFEESPSVSQDEHGGIYVTYTGGFEGAIRLAYSSTGGASWIGPATINPNTDGSAGGLVSSVGSNGQGWAVWTDNGSVVAQQFVSTDATPPTPPPLPPPPPPPPAPVSLLTIPKQTDDVTSKGGLSVVVDCSGAKCTGSLSLLVKVKKTTGKGKHKKTKTVVETIGSDSFSSLALGTDTITLKLSGKGLSLLKHDGYKLNTTGSATYLSGSVFKTTTGDVTLKAHKPKPKKPKKI
jgi:hypothetical protein